MRSRLLSVAAAFVFSVPAFAATLRLPSTITQEATGPAGAVVTYTATATANDTGTGDDENGRPIGSVTVTCAPASGSTFALGQTTVDCTASDQTKGSFHVIVRDTTGPLVTHGGDLTAQATSANGAVISSFTVAAVDLVDGPRPVSCSPGPGLFPVGTTTVTCAASDSRGNRGASSFNVTITAAPQRPPDLQVPNDITAEATGPNGAIVTYTVSAQGSGGGADDENGRPSNVVTTSCTPASGSLFPLGATTVTCTATSSGGTTMKSFKISVVDTTAPSLDLPRGFTVQAPNNDGAVVHYNASANDLVDGPVAINCQPPSGSTFAVGTTTVNCSASDSRGNGANGSFTVTVTSPGTPPPDPVLNLPDDITAEATGPNGATVTFTATVTGGGEGDDENGRPRNGSVSCNPASGITFPLGTTTVQCHAGNATGSFLIHVVDTTAPSLDLPDDILTADTTVTWTATAADLVDGALAVTCTPPSGSTFAPGSTSTVNCSAADAHGNGASGSFTVTVTSDPGTRTINVSASPDKLWPPNHQLVDVAITVTTSDDTPVDAEILNVSSSEVDPDDNTSPDWIVTGPLTLKLRSEKSAQAKVRIYAIDVKVTDVDDHVTVERVTVTVTNANSTKAMKRDS